MKLIKAYIRHRKTEEVYNALTKAGFCCMTFVEGEGTGKYADHEKDHVSVKYAFADASRVIKLEILSADENTALIVDMIRENGRTGYRGDGMILVSPVEEAYKVRTNEQGFPVI